MKKARVVASIQKSCNTEKTDEELNIAAISISDDEEKVDDDEEKDDDDEEG